MAVLVCEGNKQQKPNLSQSAENTYEQDTFNTFFA